MSEMNTKPLTDTQKDILVNMIEEASEVIQACTKMLRFGDNNVPHDPAYLINRDYLSQEYGNLVECVKRAYEHGILNSQHVNIGIAEKRRKWGQNVERGPYSTNDC